MNPTQVRQDRVRQAFSAAESYDEHARVQRFAADRLAERIASLPSPERQTICEIGCGTGFLSEALGLRLDGGRFLATDISAEMLRRARIRLGYDRRFDFAIVDGEQPAPLEERAPFDVICSSLAAQWFSNLGVALAGLVALLRPGGHLMFTTLAQGSFIEWRQAHLRSGVNAGTPPYPSQSELLALAPARTTAEVQILPYVERFGSGRMFLRSLRAIGAHTPAEEHRPLSAGQMRRVLCEFERQPQITYEIAMCEIR